MKFQASFPMSGEASLVPAIVSADQHKMKKKRNNQILMNCRFSISHSFARIAINAFLLTSTRKNNLRLLKLLDDFRFSFDRKVMLGQSLNDFVYTGLCVVEFYRDFVRKLVRIILQHARNFLQGSTYPVSCVRSFTSGNLQYDNSFRSK